MEKSPALTLSLVQKSPISNLSKIFSYTTTYSNFMFLDRLLFELLCKNTETRKHTHTHTHTHTQCDGYVVLHKFIRISTTHKQCIGLMTEFMFTALQIYRPKQSLIISEIRHLVEGEEAVLEKVLRKTGYFCFWLFCYRGSVSYRLRASQFQLMTPENILLHLY